MLARTSGNRVGDGDEAHAIEKPGNNHSLAAPHSAFDLDAIARRAGEHLRRYRRSHSGTSRCSAT